MDIDKIILKALNDKEGLENYETLEQWKSESEQHLNFLKMLEDKNSVNYKSFDKESAWNKIDKALSQGGGSKKTFALLAAAVITILICVSGFYFFNKSDNSNNTHYASIDKIEDFNLPDGSTVWLNKESTLTLADAFSSQREMNMSGEIYFDVEANPSNPFIIHLEDDSFIKVVGTEFNVIHTEDEFDLSVYSGLVQLHTLDRVIHLEKGDRVTQVNGALAKTKIRDINKLSWKNNELVFDNVTINQAIPAIEKHFDVEIEIAKELDTADCRIRSKYSTESINELLTEWRQFFDLEYIQSGNVIKIEGISCK